jgi:Zn-dependent protease with chaperone function
MPAVMDFFEHQEAARRNTGRLVALYVAAVVAIIVLVYLVIAGFIVFGKSRSHPGLAAPSLWQPDLLFYVGGGTMLFVLAASWSKIAGLRGGGQVVAESLGGRPIDLGTRDPDERKVLNVVEEMAIASGTPVPTVYLLANEPRINAFAAGFTPDRAVIGVTKGCVHQLSRDELQGVIAHEFSHILNGDMRLNIRLIGILHGILAIGLIGGMLARAAAYGGGRRSRRDGGTAGLLALGLALYVIGYLGTFFGGLIKAAVSRQREFLADAAAVDFTRNPDGIAGALKKIGGTSMQARLRAPKAEQFSHMYFGAGRAQHFQALATHPPLEQRIRRIDPRWDGQFVEVRPPSRREMEPLEKPPAAAAGPIPGVGGAGGMGALGAAVAATAVAQVGRPTPKHLKYAAELMGRLPAALKDAARSPAGAQAVAYALLLEDDPSLQLQYLADRVDDALMRTVRELAPAVREAGPETRLPLLDLAVPALRRLDVAEHEGFRKHVNALIHADDRVDPFEWVLRHIVLKYLEPGEKPVVQYYNLNGLHRECATLLSVLAHAGQDNPVEAGEAFAKGAARLKLGELDLAPRGESTLEALDGALEKLTQTTPLHKRSVLEACGACISADRKITVEEGELFRGIGEALDCPVPPLLPGQPLV